MNIPYTQDELEFIAEQLWKNNGFDNNKFDYFVLIEKLNGQIVFSNSQMSNNSPYISEAQKGYDVFLNKNHKDTPFYNLELCDIVAELFLRDKKSKPSKIEIDTLGKYLLCPYFVYEEIERKKGLSLVDGLVKNLHLTHEEIEVVLNNYDDSSKFKSISKDYLSTIISAIDNFVPDIRSKSIADVVFAFNGGYEIGIDLPIDYLFRQTEDSFEIVISSAYSSNDQKNQYVAEAFAYLFLGENCTKKERIAFAKELLALVGK